MKKFVLKLCLLAMLSVFCCGLVSPIVAIAESGENQTISVESSVVSNEEEIEQESSVELVPKSESTEWFDETLKPLLIEFGTEIAAFATVVFILLKDLNKTKSGLGTALCALTDSNNQNKDTTKAVEEFKAEVRAEMQEFKAEVMNVLGDIKNGIGANIQDIEETVHKVLDIENIAFGDSDALVSSGAAKRIAEVAKYGKYEPIENK